MKLTMTMAMVTALGLQVASTAAAAEPVPSDPQARMTAGKLAQDAGRTADAERVFAELTKDGDVPDALRCEARVRQAAAVAAGGDERRAGALYLFANRTCANDVEAMRLLVETITGVQQDPATWPGRTQAVNLVLAEQAGHLRPLVSYGAPLSATAAAETFTGEPVSVSVQDVAVSEILSLISQVSNVAFRCDPPEACAKTVTLNLVDVPWDQVVALVLGTTQLRMEPEGQGFRVIPNAFATKTGDEALLHTVKLSMMAYKQDHGSFPVAAEWTPLASLASLVEPMYVRTVPRVNGMGEPIVYRSPDGTTCDVRVGVPAEP